jgi:hypothetical protein
VTESSHWLSSRSLAATVSFLALAAAPAAGAATPNYAALPSPLVHLSGTPPLSGGAAASVESVRHRIRATTVVRVSIDDTGTPFAVQATQRLDVRVLGDYFFTIGAPALSAVAAPGSDSRPGLRTSSILWEGFDSGQRTLAATIGLEPRAASAALPLRISVRDGRVRLENATAINAQSFTADVDPASLVQYAAKLDQELRAGRTPSAGRARVTSPPHLATFRAVALLHVSGSIGARRVDLIVGTDPVTIAGSGPVRLMVKPVPPLGLIRVDTGGSGRTLLRRVTVALLDTARARQYDTYLGNPDAAGANQTTYRYRSAMPPAPIAAAPPGSAPRDNLARTLLVVAALCAALALGVVAWARS